MTAAARLRHWLTRRWAACNARSSVCSMWTSTSSCRRMACLARAWAVRISADPRSGPRWACRRPLPNASARPHPPTAWAPTPSTRRCRPLTPVSIPAGLGTPPPPCPCADPSLTCACTPVSAFSMASSGRDFDPRTRAFSDEELKPQPMIKKSRKQVNEVSALIIPSGMCRLHAGSGDTRHTTFHDTLPLPFHRHRFCLY